MTFSAGRIFSPHGSGRVDAAVVAVLLIGDGAGIVADTVTHHLTSTAQVTGLALVSAGCASAFWWRRRRPLGVLAVTVVGFVVATGIHDPPLLSQRTALQLVLATYAVASWSNRRRLAALVPAALGVLVIVATASKGGKMGGAVSVPVALIGAPWFAGYSARMRRQHLSGVEERLRRAESDRNERARLAVAEERARIARELHDVVAHHVSLIGVQAGAARTNLGRDAANTLQALNGIETSSREAVFEMRHLLDALGTPDGVDQFGPAPGLAEFGHLCDTYRSAGLTVQRSSSGAIEQLPPLHSLTLYRIAEEALTNITRHSTATTCTLHLHADRAVARVTVAERGLSRPRTTLPLPGACRGLIGMRQRVDLFGGTLNAGPVAGGGFVVEATIPMERQ